MEKKNFLFSCSKCRVLFEDALTFLIHLKFCRRSFNCIEEGTCTPKNYDDENFFLVFNCSICLKELTSLESHCCWGKDFPDELKGVIFFCGMGCCPDYEDGRQLSFDCLSDHLGNSGNNKSLNSREELVKVYKKKLIEFFFKKTHIEEKTKPLL